MHACIAEVGEIMLIVIVMRLLMLMVIMAGTTVTLLLKDLIKFGRNKMFCIKSRLKCPGGAGCTYAFYMPEAQELFD